MNLYIIGSNRNENCYKIAQDLKSVDDEVIALAGKNIKYCLGCKKCVGELKNYCVIQDDMQEIYRKIVSTDTIIIISPIYMNHITGILKNVIDRLNPYGCHPELLKDKKVYLVTIGQMSEEENKDIANNIKEYFESLGEFMEFEFVFLKNLSSGENDDVCQNYDNYLEMIVNIKKVIESKG